MLLALSKEEEAFSPANFHWTALRRLAKKTARMSLSSAGLRGSAEAPPDALCMCYADHHSCSDHHGGWLRVRCLPSAFSNAHACGRPCTILEL